MRDAIERGIIRGDGYYTKKCHNLLKASLNSNYALLTHSCTASLEMASMLIKIMPGDEVIMPSYTFVSTANAVCMRGGIPVFVDIREDTYNIDESLIEAAITPKTKAIYCVHYAGVSCDMDMIDRIAKKHNLYVVEDAAQAWGSSYKDKPCGTWGDIGCFSFHETKNVVCGEGGAIVTNNLEFGGRAEIIREKGTNRSNFLRGVVDKYTWVDIGSSYLPSDILAAFLYAQLEQSDIINQTRMQIWETYQEAFTPYKHIVDLPVIPAECQHNAHMYHMRFPSLADRTRFINYMSGFGVQTAFHYIPLHSSPAGEKFGRVANQDLPVTNVVSDTLVRLPLYYGMSSKVQSFVIETVCNFLEKNM